MGGGGGSSGSVEFPEYIQDTHANHLVGSSVDSSGAFSSSPSYPTYTLTQAMDDAFAENPYANVQVSQATTVLAPQDQQFDNFRLKVDNFTDARISDLSKEVFDHLIKIGQWTGEVEDIDPVSSPSNVTTSSLNLGTPAVGQGLNTPAVKPVVVDEVEENRTAPAVGYSAPTFDITDPRLDLSTPALGTSLSVVTRAYSEITSLVPDVATPSWTSAVAAAEQEMATAVRTSNVDALLTSAASNAEALVSEAVRVAKNVSTSSAVTDLINNFATRRQDTYQRQTASFNAQMADGQATNSSAYMVGLALLKNQQHQEEAQFDRKLVFETYTNAIDSYIESHSQSIQAETNVAVQNNQQFNQLLNEAVSAILELRIDAWNNNRKIEEQDLLQLFNNVFGSQLQAAIQTTEIDLNFQQLQAQIEQFEQEQRSAAREIESEQNLRAELSKLERELQAEQFNAEQEATTGRFLTDQTRQAKQFNLSQQLEAEVNNASREIRVKELDLALSELNKNIEQFNSEQELQAQRLSTERQKLNKQAREQRFINGMQWTVKMLTDRVQFEKAAAQLKTEQKRIEFTARQETESYETDLSAKSANWNFNVFDEAAGIIGAPQGMGRRLPESESKAGAALGGALSGAGTGAAIGSAIAPGVGTAIGAGAGAVIGGLGGLLSA